MHQIGNQVNIVSDSFNLVSKNDLEQVGVELYDFSEVGYKMKRYSVVCFFDFDSFSKVDLSKNVCFKGCSFVQFVSSNLEKIVPVSPLQIIGSDKSLKYPHWAPVPIEKVDKELLPASSKGMALLVCGKEDSVWQNTMIIDAGQVVEHMGYRLKTVPYDVTLSTLKRLLDTCEMVVAQIDDLMVLEAFRRGKGVLAYDKGSRCLLNTPTELKMISHNPLNAARRVQGILSKIVYDNQTKFPKD